MKNFHHSFKQAIDKTARHCPAGDRSGLGAENARVHQSTATGEANVDIYEKMHFLFFLHCRDEKESGIGLGNGICRLFVLSI